LYLFDLLLLDVFVCLRWLLVVWIAVVRCSRSLRRCCTFFVGVTFPVLAFERCGCVCGTPHCCGCWLVAYPPYYPPSPTPSPRWLVVFGAHCCCVTPPHPYPRERHLPPDLTPHLVVAVGDYVYLFVVIYVTRFIAVYLTLTPPVAGAGITRFRAWANGRLLLICIPFGEPPFVVRCILPDCCYIVVVLLERSGLPCTHTLPC